MSNFGTISRLSGSAWLAPSEDATPDFIGGLAISYGWSEETTREVRERYPDAREVKKTVLMFGLEAFVEMLEREAKDKDWEPWDEADVAWAEEHGGIGPVDIPKGRPDLDPDL